MKLQKVNICKEWVFESPHEGVLSDIEVIGSSWWSGQSCSESCSWCDYIPLDNQKGDRNERDDDDDGTVQQCQKLTGLTQSPKDSQYAGRVDIGRFLSSSAIFRPEAEGNGVYFPNIR